MHVEDMDKKSKKRRGKQTATGYTNGEELHRKTDRNRYRIVTRLKQAKTMSLFKKERTRAETLKNRRFDIITSWYSTLQKKSLQRLSKMRCAKLKLSSKIDIIKHHSQTPWHSVTITCEGA